MNGNVVIKSFPNGISVKLSDEPDFEKILYLLFYMSFYK